MPGTDFTNIPHFEDGVLQPDGITVVGGTVHNKVWWETVFIPYIVSLSKSNQYSNITPADLIEKVMAGNVDSPLIIQSASTHTDGSISDNTSVYILGSTFALAFDRTLSVAFKGDWCSLGPGGDYAVPVFTNANYFRRINIGIIQYLSAPKIYTIIGEEAATAETCTDPGVYDSGTYYPCGYIIVQNTGNIVDTGQIAVITPARIYSTGLMYPLDFSQYFLLIHPLNYAECFLYQQMKASLQPYPFFHLEE